MKPSAEKIRLARTSRGMSQAALADRVGVSRTTYVSWERGVLPQDDNVRKLAAALDVPMADLCDLDLMTGHWPASSRHQMRVIEGSGQRREDAPPLAHTMGDLMRVLGWLRDATTLERQAVRSMLDEIEQGIAACVAATPET